MTLTLGILSTALLRFQILSHRWLRRLAADKYFAELASETEFHVPDQNNRSRHAGGAVYEIAELPAPFGHHKRSTLIDWVAVVVGRLKICNFAALSPDCSNQRFLPPIPRQCENVRPFAAKRARDFGESASRIQNVLKNIGSHNEVECAIGDPLPLQILATDPSLVF